MFHVLFLDSHITILDPQKNVVSKTQVHNHIKQQNLTV